MALSHKLSLRSAILININVMLGSGIFLNTLPLSTIAGGYSPLVYLLVALIMLPLIMSFAVLLRQHPGGSFYTFGKQLSPFWGFVAAWSYFTGKLGSCALMLHFFATNIQQAIHSLACIPTIGIDMAMLAAFTYLNLQNLKTGTLIQTIFIVLKSIAIISIIVLGAWWFNIENLTTIPSHYTTMILGIPLVIYAFSGFEAVCSLSAHLERPEQDGPKAVLYAFVIAATIAVMFQFIYYCAIDLMQLSSTPAMHGIALFVQSVVPGIKNWLLPVLTASVGISALGGAYGIMFSNNWNLYALAQHKHTFMHQALTTLNKHNIADWCIIAQSCIIATYLLVTGGHQIALQQVSAFSGTITSAIAILALLYYKNYLPKLTKFTAIAALGSCVIMLSATILGFITKGMSGLIMFGILSAIGCTMYAVTRKQQ